MDTANEDFTVTIYETGDVSTSVKASVVAGSKFHQELIPEGVRHRRCGNRGN